MSSSLTFHVPRLPCMVNRTLSVSDCLLSTFFSFHFTFIGYLLFVVYFIRKAINKENNVFKDGIGVQGLRFKVVKLSSLIPWDLGHAEQLSFSCLWSKVISDVNISETVYPIYLKINMRRVASGDSLHINF